MISKKAPKFGAFFMPYSFVIDCCNNVIPNNTVRT